MREIKFRAWHKDAREILYEEKCGECLKWYRERQPVEVMQFTGLRDKDGMEIYDGDICKFRPWPGGEGTLVIIEWRHSCWGFRPVYPELVHEDDRAWCPFYNDQDGGWDPNGFDVIGNIHENPELMGGKKTE